MSDRDMHMQRVNEVLAVVGSLLTIGIALRIMLGPDTMTRLQMRACRAVAHGAKQGSEKLTTIALSADTTYHRLSNVTM